MNEPDKPESDRITYGASLTAIAKTNYGLLVGLIATLQDRGVLDEEGVAKVIQIAAEYAQDFQLPPSTAQMSDAILSSIAKRLTSA
jgi:hypothetical protein